MDLFLLCLMLFFPNSYRISLFCNAYVNCGRSLGQLARELGYRGKGTNGIIRLMWQGQSGISESKFDLLCSIAKVSKNEFLKYSIPKEKSSTIDDWSLTVRIFDDAKSSHS